MRNLKLGFIGLGLIGGSLAKSVKRVHPKHYIIAYNRSASSRREALQDKVVDETSAQIDNSFSDCDYIFLCTPVEQNIEYLEQLKKIIRPSCIITDVGSVKQNIHRAVEELNLTKNFIGGHPMAGSEKTGYKNSDSYLLENAYYVITPTKDVSKKSIDEFYELVQSVGAIPVLLDYKEHDYAVAAISHLPHLIAASLVNLVKDNDSEKETMKLLAAGGFKDITRIASSSPEMWQQICSTNKDNLLILIDKYTESLKQIKTSIANNRDSDIFDFFSKSREYRNSFANNVRGPINKSYSLGCDIVDESGAICTIATILAENKISIKNIGIIHNRETEAGVLKIEFYDSMSISLAKDLLERYNYRIYVYD